MEIQQALLEKLLIENPEFKKLYEEHSALKSQVEELNQRKFLTDTFKILVLRHLRHIKLNHFFLPSQLLHSEANLCTYSVQVCVFR